MESLRPIFYAVLGAALAVACGYFIVRDGLFADPLMIAGILAFGACAAIGIANAMPPRNVRPKADGTIILRAARWKNYLYVASMLALAAACAVVAVQTWDRLEIWELVLCVAALLLFAAGGLVFFTRGILRAKTYRITRNGAEKLGEDGWRIDWKDVDRLEYASGVTPLQLIILRVSADAFANGGESVCANPDDHRFGKYRGPGELLTFEIPTGAQPYTALQDIKSEQLKPIINDYWRAARGAPAH